MEILKASQSQDIQSIKAIIITEYLVGDSYQLFYKFQTYFKYIWLPALKIYYCLRN
jgi:hypothetical protein